VFIALGRILVITYLLVELDLGMDSWMEGRRRDENTGCPFMTFMNSV
jgi:hypothetical protein